MLMLWTPQTNLLLRDCGWLEDHGAHVGGTVWLNMPEMGVEGLAEVLAIEPCPPLEEGEGRLVTGTFATPSGEVYDLKLESESKPIGVTATHPFWRVDRREWVSAIDLEIGETLKTLEGTTVVESIEKRPECETVYNIEVEGDHCYRVGESGVLVHNSSPNPCPQQNDHYSCTTRRANVTWYKEPIEMSGGGAALVVESVGGADRTDLQQPPWWSTFLNTAPYSQSNWQQGHIIASRFNGRTTYCNFSAQYTHVNQRIFRRCENRIADALGCGCIRVTVTPHFGSDPAVPERFTIVAEGLGGNAYSLNVTFRNDPNEPIPTACMR